MNNSRILATAAVLIVSSTAPFIAVAQDITEKDFPKPDAVIKDGLKSVNSVRELVDGRVLVIDSVGQKLNIADLGSGKVETRMSGGTGDKEFRVLGPLWQWPGDSTAVADLLTGQLTLFAPDGAIARTMRFGLSMGSMSPGQRGQGRPGGTPPAGSSGGARGGGGSMGGGAGRGSQMPAIRFLTGTAVALGRGAPARPTAPSTSLQPPRTLYPILRMSAQAGTVDTVAQLMSAQLPRAPQLNTSVGTYSVYVGTAPVQLFDAWTAYRDGTVAVVRSAPYHVDLYTPDGSRIQLEPIPAPSIPLTNGDRKRVVDAYKQLTAEVLKSEPRRTSILAVAYEEPLKWPQIHPPFRGDVEPLVDDQDRIWVQTRCMSDEQSVCYDVIDRSGARAERYRLPPKTTVVGFGKGAVFTVVEQKSDKSQLQRHMMQ